MRLTFRDVDGVTSETSPFPDQTALFRKEGGYLPANELVANRLLAVGVELVRVGHIPRPTAATVVVGHCFFRRGVFLLLGVECIAVLVLGAANFARSSLRIYLEDRVVGPVDVWVDPQAEQVLVVVGIDARVDLCAPAVGVLSGVHSVGVENTSQLDLELHRAVLVQDPIDAIFIVGGGEDVRDHELAASRDDDAVVTEVGVLEQNTRVLFVNADSILDGVRRASLIHEVKLR